MTHFIGMDGYGFNGGGYYACVGAGSIWKTSVLSDLFCYDLKLLWKK